MIAFNLQLFAEKTERATARRRSDARREGQVALSQDLTGAAGFLAAILALRLFGGSLLHSLTAMMIWFLSHGTIVSSAVSGTAAGIHLTAFWTYLDAVATSLAPILVAATGLGVLVAFAQVGPLFVPQRILPKFSVINPVTGVGRLFSLQSLVELAKSVLKMAAVAAGLALAFQSYSGQIMQLMGVSPNQVFNDTAGATFSILIDVGVVFLALSVGDFAFRRFQLERSLRMTKQEVKDELRSAEGNREMKQKIRERGYRIAFRRMMQRVPTADVVVTNPTHYAVALKYEASRMHAPQVVAKGVDETAQRIRKLASEHGVPLVESPSLARQLYQSVELEGFVPGELFQAVAEVLAYVYRLRGRTRTN